MADILEDMALFRGRSVAAIFVVLAFGLATVTFVIRRAVATLAGWVQCVWRDRVRRRTC